MAVPLFFEKRWLLSGIKTEIIKQRFIKNMFKTAAVFGIKLKADNM